MKHSRITGLLGMAMAMSAIASANIQPSGKVIPTGSNQIVEPSWQRKKCKSCRNCGCYCNPYQFRGSTLMRHSKPTYNACDKYTKK